MNIFEGPLPAYPASLITLVVKNLSGNAGDIRDKGSIPGLGRSPGVGNGNPLQCSCLDTPWTEEPGGLQSIGSKRVAERLMLSLGNTKLTSVLPIIPALFVFRTHFEC